MSVAGKQKGIEDPRHLWPYIAEGIRTIRPVGCFFENVRNHLNIDWEPPRVESRLGFMLNGYNFREDFLRMAGNGVVEDTAEVAFIDLLNQFNQP